MAKLSGGLNNWYVVPVKHPQRKEQEPYQAECEDIIQALGMTFDEGCAFKALWRNAAARMGNGKPGNKAVYDCEKLVHYANRILAKERLAEEPVVKDVLNSGCSNWVYSNEKPILALTKPFVFIEVMYKDQHECSPPFTYYVQNIGAIHWPKVYKYRIIY